MITRVAGAVKLQQNVSDKVLEQKVRKLLSNALPSSGWRGMVGRKAGMSLADLQRQVKTFVTQPAGGKLPRAPQLRHLRHMHHAQSICAFEVQ